MNPPHDHPVPEAPDTLEAQMDWLRQGKRKAVLIPSGSVLPGLPETLGIARVPEGLIIFDPCQTNSREILEAKRQDRLGALLGYGVAAKPSGNGRHPVVVVRGPDGREKQAAVAPSECLDEALQAARQVRDAGDTVSTEDGARVVADRLRSLDARELQVRPYHPEADALALQAAAKADAHTPLHPTHVIERDGEIVGYLGVNSLPLFRLWFHSQKLKAADSLRLLFMIENHYRMAGVPLVATVIHTASPFYPNAARGGYLECAGDRLFLKSL